MVSKLVPEGWIEIRLGQYLKEIKERNGSHGRLPVLSVTNTQGFVLSEEYFERKVYSKNLDNYKIVRKGQFAYNPSRLNVGSLARLKNYDAGLLSPMYVIFETLSDIDADFLSHWLKTGWVKNLIKVSTQGTVRDSVNYSALAAFPIALPSLPEQRKIAAILSSVDDAIEKTKTVIEQTKVVKKGLMQELLTRGIPGRHKKFKKTPIGEIPEEWEVVRLGDVLREPIKNGYSPNCNDEITGYWVLSLSSVSFDGFKPRALKPAPANNEMVLNFILEYGDIVVSRSNTKERVGLAGVYIGNPKNCSYPDLLMRVRVIDKIVSPFWLEKWLLSSKGRAYFERTARGTSGSMVKINKAILESLALALPPKDEQEQILSILQSLDSRATKDNEILSTLELNKSALMQVLLTGEVRVKV